MVHRSANPPEVLEEEQDLTSRGDIKRANRVVEDTLERLSANLYGLSKKKLVELDLPDELVEAVQLAHAIASPRARARQLRLVRSVLRDLDWSSINERTLTLLEHGVVSGRATTAGEATQPETAWVARLVGEGAPGLEAFLREFVRADRTHLRKCVRSVEKASGERRIKAERKLRDTVRSILTDRR